MTGDLGRRWAPVFRARVLGPQTLRLLYDVILPRGLPGTGRPIAHVRVYLDGRRVAERVERAGGGVDWELDAPGPRDLEVRARRLYGACVRLGRWRLRTDADTLVVMACSRGSRR